MKRVWLISALVLGLSACAQPPAGALQENPEPEVSAALPDLGLAPELANEIWLNVEAPLRLANLLGRVVAIDMWTYG